MPSHFTLRMQFNPQDDPEDVRRQLLELVATTPVDEVMFFFFAEEYNDGHEQLDRIRYWLDRSRPYRQALADKGVIVSANPWHTLLHGDRRRTLKPGQNWQQLVDQNGLQASAQACPLDGGWRAYYEETLNLYAAEGFRVIWIDDDVRLHNHLPLDWGGCWCPLHVAEFNRRAGTNAARAQIVANCTAPGKPHPWRGIWMDMNEDVYFEMISRWREIVEERGSRLGLMSSYVEAHGAEGRRWGRWWKAFGGDRPPIHRPAFCDYTEKTGDHLAQCIATLDQMRGIQPEGVESGPEVDNGPYGAWNRSYRQTGTMLALSHILGSTNINLSLFDFMGNRLADEPSRAQFLRDWRPACDWLADEFPMTMRSVGVGVPWSEEMGRRIRTERGGSWKTLKCPTRGWSKWLLAAGQAVSMRPSPAVNALAGPVAWAFSDEEIRKWLSTGLLLDGPAATILVERGFGEFLGVKHPRCITQRDVLFTVEQSTDAEFALHADARMPLNAVEDGMRLFQADLARGARAVSELRTPTWEPAGHGLVVFENSLGGRVAIVPWEVNWGFFYMSVQRSGQMAKTLDWLDPKNTRGWAEGGAWLMPQFLSDGRRRRGVIWNASADEIQSFSVRAPSGFAFRSAAQFDARGRRYDDGRVEGARVTLARPMHQWEFVVLA